MTVACEHILGQSTAVIQVIAEVNPPKLIITTRTLGPKVRLNAMDQEGYSALNVEALLS